MTITRIPHSRAYRCETIADGRLVHMTYYGYPKRECVRRFRAHVRSLTKGEV